MKRPDTILDEIHATRRKIDERTREMTASERTAYFNERGRIFAEKYGFTIVERVPVRSIPCILEPNRAKFEGDSPS